MRYPSNASDLVLEYEKICGEKLNGETRKLIELYAEGVIRAYRDGFNEGRKEKQHERIADFYI